MKCFKRARHIISFFLVFFVEIASKLEMFSLNFSSFNLFPSLPSVATNGRKQNERHNIVSHNKPRTLFLEFCSAKTYLGLKKAKIMRHSPFHAHGSNF